MHGKAQLPTENKLLEPLRNVSLAKAPGHCLAEPKKYSRTMPENLKEDMPDIIRWIGTPKMLWTAGSRKLAVLFFVIDFEELQHHALCGKPQAGKADRMKAAAPGNDRRDRQTKE